jgi:voltage-gated potassium channel Kch
MRTVTFAQKLRYRFDNSMSKGTPALIGWLAVVSFVMLTIYSLIVFVGSLTPHDDLTDYGPLNAFWTGLMLSLDAGTLGGVGANWPYRIAGLFATMSGVFVLSALIGVLNSGLEGKLEDLRKGRSLVVEDNHALIVGWSESIYTIVGELIEAGSSKADAVIVVLADKDKVEMEEALNERIEDWKSTRLVCRSGSTSDLEALDKVNVQGSRCIVLLSPELDDPDVQVIKSIVAITNSPTRRAEPYHIVAELKDDKNVSVARMVGKNEIEVILAGDLISRITVQTCRQSGLSVVHTELLDFGGDEIYFKAEPALLGRTVGEALSAFKKCAIIGVYANGQSQVLPPLDRVITAADQLIVIAADDDVIKVSNEKVEIIESAILSMDSPTMAAERTLILGWNERAASIVKGLDAYVSKGSSLLLISEGEHGDALTEAVGALNNLTVEVRQADTTSRALLDSLDVATWDHIIVLCSSELEAEPADARVLVTLLHLRDISERTGAHLAVVSEMRDVRNRQISEVTKADDFIVSERLVSLMMTQVAENKHLNAVLADLFDPEGAEIYIKPVNFFVKPGVEVTYATVVESARRQGQIAIGYRIAAKGRDPQSAYGVTVNPDKAERLTFAIDDKIIVVSED